MPSSRIERGAKALKTWAVGNAQLDGLTKSLHIIGNEYLLMLTIYFTRYVSPAFEIRGEIGRC